MLRRITPPRDPQGSAKGPGKPGQSGKSGQDAPAPETTQVLRRVNAPRKGEPGGPGTAGTSATGSPASGPTGHTTGSRPGGPSARAAGTAGAAAAGALGAAGTAKAAGAAGAAGTAGAATAANGAASGPRAGTGTGPTPGQTPPSGSDTSTGTGADDGKGKGKKKAKKPKRTGWRRFVPTWKMTLGTFVFLVLAVIGLFFVGYSLVDIPPANALATKQANVYLYADGSQIARDTRDSQVNREKVTLAEVSKDAQHAVLAAEDRDFYTESAIDPKAMLRAAWNTATGKGKQSGSTITQQYVKNYYLAQEQTVTRKAKEFFISIKLDRNKSKDEILEGYLNTSYFGRNAYGIQAAAQAYYGRDAKDLDPARAAYLAALVNAPSEYDVVAHPENRSAAVARWNYVLDGMVKQGWLSQSERTGMKFPMPKEQTLSTGMSGQRGYLVDAVKHYLIANHILDSDQLEAGGYRITTTIQKGKQDAFVKAVNDQLVSKLDKKNNKVDSYVRAGGASVDPKTGQVVAMYGGIDYVKQYTNGATRGDFQVGSTFKPFVFTSAVQNGSTTEDGRRITPNTQYDGTNERPVQGWNGGAYAPQNEDQKSYGQITVTKATDLSVNAVYAQMAVDVGPSKVKQTAIDLGIPADTPDLQPYPSIALGPATASVLDMAEGYATLANHGKHGTYTMVKKITRNGTDEIKLPDTSVKQAVSRAAADTTTAMLKSVVQGGTATAAQGAGRPAAGKTGTAENDTAAWFAGYTPDLATVVSVMGQDPVTAKHMPLYGALGQARMNGGGPPTQIWAQYTHDALKNTPASSFDLQLQEGADQPQPPGPGDPSASAGTDGSDTGGTTEPGGTPSGTPSDGGTTGTPADGGAATGGAADGGAATGGTATGGTDPGDGGAAGGSPNGGAAAGGGQGGGQGGGGGTPADGGGGAAAGGGTGTIAGTGPGGPGT
ncbi:transglycosylase domain-containing protein [Streptomyces sp. WP-1]|uniref:transglycosylase domain-containing protein n=1 Tax=Streptomyces sp. WP-1 TaxID=3041497 RepID=UPI00264728E8|nr:transglycosylase domain-containing protein [Streptomyces sp. WP-1]WKE73885.1 transglycosylase domain-containing protein [Streptomyces sp. WP-1]